MKRSWSHIKKCCGIIFGCFISLFCLAPSYALGQNPKERKPKGVEETSLEIERSDSLDLSILELIEFVQNSHPLVRAYRYESLLGKASLREKRGAFDPRFTFDKTEKEAGTLPYYRRESVGLELPTASPLQFETGFESGRGTYINPESFTPAEGLSYAGISVPLLKGLLTDERRTTLAKAKIFRTQSLEIQKIQLQDLSQTIWGDYVDWYIAHEQEKAYRLGMMLSLDRQIALRQLFEAGGCNGMDTLENYIQLELFRTRAKEWNANTYKQRLQLSRHLWEISGEEGSWKGVVIAENILPTSAGLDFLDSLFVQTAVESIVLGLLPDLKNIDWDLQQKQLDLRLQRYNLLPKFDLEYQQLFQGIYGDNNFNGDRRFGFNISAPLFLRKERGAYLVSKYTFEQKTQLFQFKLNETDLKIRALRQQGFVYRDVYEHLKNVENGYLKLFELEREKFDSGDGTIFLLNTRENRYLSSRIKTIEQKSKYIHTLVDYLRETGKISQSFFGPDGL
jgi:hypothetical protein